MLHFVPNSVEILTWNFGKKLLDGDQDQEEVEAEVEGAHEDISLPQRITRSKFKELGSSGKMFSLFVVSFV